jgi:outer membrane receptor protein involved in Fe transport
MTRSRSLLLALAALTPPLAAQARPDTTASRDTVYLTPIAVTATRSPKDVFLTPVPVDVFDRTAIRGRAPNSVADLFRGRAGLDVSGVGLNQIRPIIRGQRGQRILLLSDGQRLNNSRRQQDFGEVPALVDVAAVDRVEVVRGPASVLYGSDAIGGVVNVITRSPETAGLHGSGGARYSAADDQERVYASAAGRFGRWGVQVGGAVRGSRDYDAPAGTFGSITLADPTRVNDTGGSDWSVDAYLGYRLAENHEVFARLDRYDADTAGFGYIDPAAYAPGDPTIRITYPAQTFTKLGFGYRGSPRLSAGRPAGSAWYVQDNERKLDLDVFIPIPAARRRRGHRPAQLTDWRPARVGQEAHTASLARLRGRRVPDAGQHRLERATLLGMGPIRRTSTAPSGTPRPTPAPASSRRASRWRRGSR